MFLALGALGFGGIYVREEHGGSGLTRLDAAYAAFLDGGFAALRHRYEELHGLVGLAVTIDGTPPLAGTVRGVDDGGALLVETAGGIERVVSGEVTLRNAYRKLRRGRA